MNPADDQLIERIVRDVIARLRDVDEHPSANAVSASGSTGPCGGTLVLDEPVLTEESLAALVNGHRSIVVGPRTVLTPTAHDFLRHRGIDCSRSTSTAPSSAGVPRAGHVILVGDAPAATSAVNAVGWEHRRANCWKRATADAVDALTSDGARVVVFAEHDAAVGCLANRNPHVRAAIVDDAHGVRAAREMIGPNMLVVDPTGKSFVDLRGILREFAGGSTTPPPGWEG